jgi:internalin A
MTRVSDLAPLAGLSALRTLEVSGTRVSDLSPLIPLIRRGTPVKLSSPGFEGDGAYVEGCPLTNPPPEIVRQGYDAILNYFREREQHVRLSHEGPKANSLEVSWGVVVNV